MYLQIFMFGSCVGREKRWFLSAAQIITELPLLSAPKKKVEPPGKYLNGITPTSLIPSKKCR
jgi:hypothetical protein